MHGLLVANHAHSQKGNPSGVLTSILAYSGCRFKALPEDSGSELMMISNILVRSAGIEVLVPALMRINAGAVNDYTDSDGAVWAADHSFVGAHFWPFLHCLTC